MKPYLIIYNKNFRGFELYLKDEEVIGPSILGYKHFWNFSAYKEAREIGEKLI